MKKLFCLLLCLVLTGCAAENVLTPGDKTFCAQYIRISGYAEMKEPIVTVIRSTAQLDAYYEENKEAYGLEGAWSDDISFRQACEKYDEAYFENRILVLVLLEEGSGSNRHEVTDVSLTEENRLVIKIRRIVPDAGTCDMAYWQIFVEPEAGVDPAHVAVDVDGSNMARHVETVEYSHGNANMSLKLPEGWEYELEPHSETTDSFGISIWPEGQEKGELELRYYADMFGVCGTGLHCDRIQLGDHEGTQGFYDDNTLWTYIHFDDIPGDYVVWNSGTDAWWEEYGDEAMEILNTVKLAQGLPSKSQAVELVRQKSGEADGTPYARFDRKTNGWLVTLNGQLWQVDLAGNVMKAEEDFGCGVS